MAMSSAANEAVLIVEVDEDAALLKRRVLECHGFEVVSVGTVRSALAVLQPRSFDLVVADYRLQNETGLELFEQIPALGYDVPVYKACCSCGLCHSLFEDSGRVVSLTTTHRYRE